MRFIQYMQIFIPIALSPFLTLSLFLLRKENRKNTFFNCYSMLPTYLITNIYTSQPPTSSSIMRRHRHIRLQCHRILTPPQTRNSLPLRIEPQSILPVKVTYTTTRNTLLVACKTEHGQWDRDGHVDSDLAGFDVALEAAGGGAGSGEDCGAVAVFVGVD